MVKKYIAFLLILTVLLFTLTGCYDSTGIENFYYIVAIGIDKCKENEDLITLHVQNAKPTSSSSGSSSQSNESKIYSVDCKTIESGINILNNYLNKKINLSHCSAIIFSEEMAKSGIKSYINTLGNDTEVRATCNVIVSSKSAYDLLDTVSNSSDSFSSRLYDYILNSVDYTGYTIDSNFNSFSSRINNKETQAVAIYSIVNDDTIQNSGAAVFKDGSMVGTICPLRTIAHLMITNHLEACMIPLSSPFDENGVIDVNIKKLQSPDIDVSLKDNHPFIKIDLRLQGSINSSGEEFDYTNRDNIKKLEDNCNHYIEILVNEYLDKIVKEYDADIAGFGGMLSSKFLTVDDYEKVHWNDIFKDATYEVHVNTTITSSQLLNRE